MPTSDESRPVALAEQRRALRVARRALLKMLRPHVSTTGWYVGHLLPKEGLPDWLPRWLTDSVKLKPNTGRAVYFVLREKLKDFSYMLDVYQEMTTARTDSRTFKEDIQKDLVYVRNILDRYEAEHMPPSDTVEKTKV